MVILTTDDYRRDLSRVFEAEIFLRIVAIVSGDVTFAYRLGRFPS
jgi:hypothetical protein